MKSIKIDLSEREREGIAVFNSTLGASHEAIKSIIKKYISELESVRGIDVGGNMGLQTLARINALEIVAGLYDTIFTNENLASRTDARGRAKSQWV